MFCKTGLYNGHDVVIGARLGDCVFTESLNAIKQYDLIAFLFKV